VLVALGVSVLGVSRDKRRLLALITTAISTVFTLALLIVPDAASFFMTLLCG